MYDLKMMVEMQQEFFKMMEPYFEQLGLKLYVDRIVLYPKECGNKCIEFVWRLECKTVEVCEEARSKLVEYQAEYQGVEIGGEEKEER